MEHVSFGLTIVADTDSSVNGEGETGGTRSVNPDLVVPSVKRCRSFV